MPCLWTKSPQLKSRLKKRAQKAKRKTKHEKEKPQNKSPKSTEIVGDVEEQTKQEEAVNSEEQSQKIEDAGITPFVEEEEQARQKT